MVIVCVLLLGPVNEATGTGIAASVDGLQVVSFLSASVSFFTGTVAEAEVIDWHFK